MLLFISFLYDIIAQQFSKVPVKQVIKSQKKLENKIDQLVIKEGIKIKFAIEINGSKVDREINAVNFKILISDYFIATDYLFELWSQYPFHLTINDDLHLNYGRPKDSLGFIKSGEISEIYVLNGVSKKQKTGILIHEIAHDRAYREARGNKIKIQAHGKEFKRHLSKLFEPLIINDEHFLNYKQLSKHIRYDARKYSPPLSLCE